MYTDNASNDGPAMESNAHFDVFVLECLEAFVAQCTGRLSQQSALRHFL